MNLHAFQALQPLSHQGCSVIALHADATSDAWTHDALASMERLLLPSRTLAWSSWSFQSLERLDVRSLVLHSMASVDVLLLASSAQEPLPEQVLRWLESSFQSHASPRPLLIACLAPGSACIQDLHAFASRWQTPLIVTAEVDLRPQAELICQHVEQRCLHREKLESEADHLLTECHPASTARMPGTEPCVTELNQRIRDHAYFLWLEAGRPHDRQLDFWLEAERSLATPTPPFAPPSAGLPHRAGDLSLARQPHNPDTHENHPPSADPQHGLPSVLQRVPSASHQRPGNALLQHLASLPQKLLIPSQTEPACLAPAARGSSRHLTSFFSFQHS